MANSCKQLDKYEKIREEVIFDINKTFKKNMIIGIILIPAFLIGILVIFYAYSKRERDLKEISKKLKETLLHEIVKDNLGDNANYSSNNGINLTEVMETGIINKPSSYKSEDLVYGTYKGIKYKSADIELKKIVQTYTPDGSVISSESLFFKGKYIRIDLINNKDLIVVVKEKSNINNTKNIPGNINIELESMAFNSKFDTKASSELDAFYVLTPQIQEKMLELESKFNGSINYIFKNGYLYILINDGRDSLEVLPKKKIDSVFFNSIISDLTISLAVIDEFSLDSMKWTK